MTKKIHFITQAKGGSGKSVLAFMLAEKYSQAAILDLDDATTTTMKQLAYRKPVKVSFLDPTTKRIDRGAFNGLFESVVLSFTPRSEQGNSALGIYLLKTKKKKRKGLRK